MRTDRWTDMMNFCKVRHPRCVSKKSTYKVYAYIVKHNYVLGGMVFTVCKAQLHVSATSVGIVLCLYMVPNQPKSKAPNPSYTCEISLSQLSPPFTLHPPTDACITD